MRKNIAVVEFTLNEYNEFLDRLNPEIEKCKSLIGGGISSAARLYLAAKKNHINKVFDAMVDHVDQVVSENFGDNEKIKQEVEKAFSVEQEKASLETKAKCDQLTHELHEKIKDAQKRLQQDMNLIYLESRVDFEGGMDFAIGGANELGGDLGVLGVGGILFTVGSMAYTGFLVGLPGAPVTGGIPVSAIVGGIIGALVGLASSLLTVFMSKESRIRKVKGKVFEKLDEARSRQISSVSEDVASYSDFIREHVSDPVLQGIAEMKASLEVPVSTLQQEIERLKTLKTKIEVMPYGSI